MVNLKRLREVAPEIKIIGGLAAFLVLAVTGFAAFFMTTVATKDDVAMRISPLATKVDVATLATSDDLDTLEGAVGTLRETVGVLSNTVNTLSQTVDRVSQTVNTLSETVGRVNDTVIALSGTVDNANSTVNRVSETVDTLDGAVENLDGTIPLLVSCTIDLHRQMTDGETAFIEGDARPTVPLPESCEQARRR